MRICFDLELMVKGDSVQLETGALPREHSDQD